MIRGNEVELKLELPPREVAAFRALPQLSAPTGAAEELETIYFDTVEGSLRKAGYSLRVRRSPAGHVQTVKYRHTDSGGFSDRAEWEKPVRDSQPDLAAAGETPLGKLLARKKVRDRLTQVSRTRVRRTTWLLSHGESEIELILDQGEVSSGDRRHSLCEIELELKNGGREDLFRLAREIGESVTLRTGVMSKSERGFMLLEKRKARVKKAERVALQPEMTVAEAFGAIVQACLRHFRLNEPLLKKRNMAALHQVRVAMRRLRSALVLFKPVAADEEWQRVRENLRWFTDQLGAARNLDVLLSTHDRPRAGQRIPASRLRELRETRKDTYQAVTAALASDRLPALILDLVSWAETGGWRRSEPAGQPIARFAGERLERRWRKVRKAGKDIGGMETEAQHRLRIDVKKLRYAAEFFAGLTPKTALGRQKTFIGVLEELQDSLGKLNDIETARQLAPETSVDEGEVPKLLACAQHAHDRLRKQGPYWRFPSGRSSRPV